MVQPRVYVEAPPVTPLPYGLLSTAAVVDDPTPRWLNGGIQYEPELACEDAHETIGACLVNVFGSVSISVDDAAEATISTTDQPVLPVGAYTVDWGDDSDPELFPGDTDGATHTYADPGDYTVTISGPNGYSVVVVVTVEDAEASGPFDTDATFSKLARDGLDLVTSDAFAVYQLFRCRPVGQQQGVDRAQQSLRLSEGRAVESHVALQLSDATPVDLTPGGGPVEPLEGLALLEAYAARHYGGVPVVHVSRGVGTLLTQNGAVVRGGQQRLETQQGALVASGGGYEDLFVGVQDAGEAIMYVTGAVLVRRSAVISTGPVMDANPPTNEFSALSERPYVAAWECITAVVTVTYPNGAA